ncbi:hypothetical protein K469DRAFT_315672 [Zopfia rhizophila CBS 207.26]|uniref:Uncharacterized protein n=1 Tax=Zopfia rhizophila CBS 207.26 TaxID=1314779 RepID=A0A6A6EMX6_9PEZI|nr:hypothetical protein K469DRAFT_315672 [Zopfia rhizophila CBS 207.26]
MIFVSSATTTALLRLPASFASSRRTACCTLHLQLHSFVIMCSCYRELHRYSATNFPIMKRPVNVSGIHVRCRRPTCFPRKLY